VAPSIDDYENRRRCWFRGCSQEREGTPFCEEHWGQVPDDLQYRIGWAYENGNTMDWIAAIRAAVQAIRE
jgi:hypothetical protein